MQTHQLEDLTLLLIRDADEPEMWLDRWAVSYPMVRVAEAARTQHIEALGYRVLRFWKNDVLGNLDGVLAEIQSALTPPPDPSPQGGGEMLPAAAIKQRCRLACLPPAPLACAPPTRLACAPPARPCSAPSPPWASVS